MLASETVRVLRDAQALQKMMHDSYVAQDHVLTVLLKALSMAPVFKEAGLTEATLVTAIEQIHGNRRVESRTAEQGFDALGKYAVDLTALAKEGKIDLSSGVITRSAASFVFFAGGLSVGPQYTGVI